MTRRRPFIAQRRRIFLGCEGRSEQAYGTLLSRLARARQDMQVHINAIDLNPGAGDPLAIVTRAEQYINRGERGREPYAVKAVLLDRDKFGDAPDRDAQVGPRAERAGRLLIWQRPVHEAFLLRHLGGCEYLQPAKDRCQSQLAQRWPDYAKPMTAEKLAERISLDAVTRASGVEPELKSFLGLIGWL